MTASVTMPKKIDCIRIEKRPIARASAAAAMSPITSALQFVPTRVEREANAVGADAEEHHMRERHDARITSNGS